MLDRLIIEMRPERDERMAPCANESIYTSKANYSRQDNPIDHFFDDVLSKLLARTDECEIWSFHEEGEQAVAACEGSHGPPHRRARGDIFQPPQLVRGINNCITITSGNPLKKNLPTTELMSSSGDRNQRLQEPMESRRGFWVNNTNENANFHLRYHEDKGGQDEECLSSTRLQPSCLSSNAFATLDDIRERSSSENDSQMQCTPSPNIKKSPLRQALTLPNDVFNTDSYFFEIPQASSLFSVHESGSNVSDCAGEAVLDRSNKKRGRDQQEDMLLRKRADSRVDELRLADHDGGAFEIRRKRQNQDLLVQLEPRPIGTLMDISIVDRMPVIDPAWIEDEDLFRCIQSLIVRTRRHRSRGTRSPPIDAGPVPHSTAANFPAAKAGNQQTRSFGDFAGKSLMESDHTDSPPEDPNIKAHQSKQWNERHTELVKFHQEFGHVVVPYHYKANIPLALWVKRQRHQYKLKIEGLHSTMTNERQKALEDLGFVWDSHKATWEEHLNELISFRDKEGHCNVPATYEDSPQLAIWVKCQRRQYKLFRSGHKSNITEERIARLKKIGFSWDPRLQRQASNARNSFSV